jgi:hypothetical protein
MILSYHNPLTGAILGYIAPTMFLVFRLSAPQPTTIQPPHHGQTRTTQKARVGRIS